MLLSGESKYLFLCASSISSWAGRLYLVTSAPWRGGGCILRGPSTVGVMLVGITLFFHLLTWPNMMARLHVTSSQKVTELVKRLEDPGFPARGHACKLNLVRLEMKRRRRLMLCMCSLEVEVLPCSKRHFGRNWVCKHDHVLVYSQSE